MKTHPWSCLAALALFTLPLSSIAQSTITLDYFYDELAPYGDWLYVEDYGHCFRPFVSMEDQDWRPYSEGYWAETDAGWTWVSEEDFGWATYHYGRWVEISGSWTWVPGYDWAPAWVSWRRSPEYVGWAPLPPEARWNISIGFQGSVDARFDIGPRCYNFVPVRHFGASRYRSYLVDRRENINLVNRTTNITNITYQTTQVTNITNIYNGGPDFDEMNRLSENKLRRLKLEGGNFRNNDQDQKAPLRNHADETRLRVFAPSVDSSAPAREPAKVKTRFKKDAVDRGWRQVDPQAAKELRQKFAQESSSKFEPGESEERKDRPKKETSTAESSALPPPPRPMPQPGGKSEREATDDLPRMRESESAERKKEEEPSSQRPESGIPKPERTERIQPPPMVETNRPKPDPERKPDKLPSPQESAESNDRKPKKPDLPQAQENPPPPNPQAMPRPGESSLPQEQKPLPKRDEAPQPAPQPQKEREPAAPESSQKERAPRPKKDDAPKPERREAVPQAPQAPEAAKSPGPGNQGREKPAGKGKDEAEEKKGKKEK